MNRRRKLLMMMSGVKFDPSSLFANGEEGVWYEPKPEYLFQDSAGTTPVTADGQPVGLMLDRSKGLDTGTRIESNGEFNNGTTGWLVNGGVTSSVENGVMTVSDIGTTGGKFQDISSTEEYLKVKVRIRRVLGASTQLWITNIGTFDTPRRIISIENSDFEEYELIHLNASGEGIRVYLRCNSDSTLQVSDVSVQEIPGNHATQDTTASKPLYRTDGTLHWLEFDGVDDFMFSLNNVQMNSDAFLCCGSEGLGDGTETIFWQGSSNANRFQLFQSVSGVPALRSAGANIDHTVTSLAKYVFRMEAGKSPDYLRGWVNRGDFVESNASQIEWVDTGITLGATHIGAQNGNIKLYGVVFCTNPVSEKDGLESEAYFAKLAGVEL